jgi:putative aminopeptidase FrvX
MDINSPEIRKRAIEFYKEILSIPSPVGHTENLINKIQKDFEEIGFKSLITPTGKLFVHLPGQTNKHVLFLIHADNIGLMVKNIEKNKIFFIDKGAILLRTLLEKRCTIHSYSGIDYQGLITTKINSLILDVEKADEMIIDHENVYINLLDTHNSSDYDSTGIESGDVISINPEIEFLANDNIISRGQDNKAGVLAIYIASLLFKKNNTMPKSSITIGFNTTEEIGEPIQIPDLRTISSIQNPSDFDYCGIIDAVPTYPYSKMDLDHICIAKSDKPGIYNINLIKHISSIAEQTKILYLRALLIRYACDGTVMSFKAGFNVPLVLFGFGCDRVHQLEQTKLGTILNCAKITWHLLTDMPYERGNI